MNTKYDKLDIQLGAARPLMRFALWNSTSEMFAISPALLLEDVKRASDRKGQKECFHPLMDSVCEFFYRSFDVTAQILRGEATQVNPRDRLFQRRFRFDPVTAARHIRDKASFYQVGRMEVLACLEKTIKIVLLGNIESASAVVLDQKHQLSDGYALKLEIEDHVACLLGREALFNFIRTEFTLEPVLMVKRLRLISHGTKLTPECILDYMMRALPAMTTGSLSETIQILGKPGKKG